MLKSEAKDGLVNGVFAALTNYDAEELRRLTRQMAQAHPFMYSFLHDTLRAATHGPRSGKQADEFLRVVKTRVRSLANWQQQGNETVAAIEAGDIDADAIKPHIRREASAYEQFYTDQSERIGSNLAAVPRAGRDVDFVALELGPNVNHAFRSTHAVTLVETILGTIEVLRDREGPVRWIDIGCGTGRFANGVNPRRFGVQKWDIVGCDFQEGKIAVANRRRARGRSFFCSDAFKMLEEYRQRGEPFHLVSMFEFLEHLDDPLRFIRQLDTFHPNFVLAASPLAQKMGNPRDIKPDPVHLWSFSRRGWEQMFELAGFEVAYSAEVRVGSYIGGLDWLTVVCGPREQLKARRQAFAAAAEE
jgi:SAM-dependent methyltransferase